MKILDQTKHQSTRELLLQKMELLKERLLWPTDRRNKLILGVVIAVIIIATPFLFYSYRLISTDLTEVEILGITIKAGEHGNLNYYAYYLFTKLVFLLLFILWYITNKYWWKNAILVPMTMMIFQIVSVVNTSVNYIDEVDFWYSLPIIIAVLVPVIYTSRKLNFYTTGLDLKDEIELEIKSISQNKNKNA